MIGFCGTLKGDEFRLGDIGVASQVDCYMEKAKIANGGVDLCGEVYRTTLEYVRLARNLRYLDPDGYEAFCRDSMEAWSRCEIDAAQITCRWNRLPSTRPTLPPRRCCQPPKQPSSGYATAIASSS